MTIGVDFSAAAGPVGRTAAGAVMPTAAVYTYSRSKGLFVGVSLEGAVIGTQRQSNFNYYGGPSGPINIKWRNKGTTGRCPIASRAWSLKSGSLTHIPTDSGSLCMGMKKVTTYFGTGYRVRAASSKTSASRIENRRDENHGLTLQQTSYAWTKETAHRLAAYSDAVFAVIVTVMVRELKAPKQAALSALWPLWPTAISRASYLFIAIIWINHHYLTRFVGTPTPGFIWINFVHLFMVSLLPFATAWVARTRLACPL